MGTSCPQAVVPIVSGKADIAKMAALFVMVTPPVASARSSVLSRSCKYSVAGCVGMHFIRVYTLLTILFQAAVVKYLVQGFARVGFS